MGPASCMRSVDRNVVMEQMTVLKLYLFLISNLMHKIIVYLYIIHLLKCSKCFEHFPAHLQEVYVVIVYICSLWYRSFLTGAQDSHLQTVRIPEAAYIQLRLGPPEDEENNARNM
jgi:hypothetical protein